MGKVEFDCPHCGEHIVGDERLYGASVTCSECGGAIVVPEKPAGPPPRVAVLYPAEEEEAPRDDDEGERDVFDLAPSVRAFAGAISWGILLLPLVIGLFILLSVWIKVASLRYRLTTQRLFVRRGLIAKRLEELELFRVKDVIVQQGVLQRFLGVGTVTVLSTDDSTPRLDLVGVLHPIDVKEAVRKHYRAARKREGVHPAEFITS